MIFSKLILIPAAKLAALHCGKKWIGWKAKRKAEQMKAAVLQAMPKPGTIITIDEEDVIMKKSTFAAVLAFLACATGALTAFALYLRRREKELAEYEQLLFDAGEEEEEAQEEPAKEEEYVLSVDETPEE